MSRLSGRMLGQFSGLATRGHFTLVNHYLEDSGKDTKGLVRTKTHSGTAWETDSHTHTHTHAHTHKHTALRDIEMHAGLEYVTNSLANLTNNVRVLG